MVMLELFKLDNIHTSYMVFFCRQTGHRSDIKQFNHGDRLDVCHTLWQNR